MDRAPIPDDVRRFILMSIPSVPYLEAMLLLRVEAAQTWQPKSLAKRLYVSDKIADTLLSQLHTSGILEMVDEKTPSYRYYPTSDNLREIIDQVADVYSRNLIEVTNLIHSQMDRKAHRLADAFIWRKDS